MAKSMIETWGETHDHVVVTEVNDGSSMPGLRWGSSLAHRAIPGIACAAGFGDDYDFLILADDDTFVRVDQLDFELRRIDARPDVPMLAGVTVNIRHHERPGEDGFVERRNQRCKADMSRPCLSEKRDYDWETSYWKNEEGIWWGWPYGGTGTVLSRAAVDAVARNASGCIVDTSCPFWGANMKFNQRERFRLADSLIMNQSRPHCRATDTGIAHCLYGTIGIVPIELKNSTSMCPWSAHPREYKRQGCPNQGNFTAFLMDKVMRTRGCCDATNVPLAPLVDFETVEIEPCSK